MGTARTAVSAHLSHTTAKRRDVAKQLLGPDHGHFPEALTEIAHRAGRIKDKRAMPPMRPWKQLLKPIRDKAPLRTKMPRGRRCRGDPQRSHQGHPGED